jgi:two-component system phosphate regulon response regulator PhoB
VLDRIRSRHEAGLSASPLQSSSVTAARMRTPVASKETRPQRERPLVLVVDDEQDLVELIGLNLERNGIDALPAANGEAALNLARRHRPDLILLDLMLPGLDGTEVAGRLREDEKLRSVPIVMLTAKGEESDELVGLTLGADDYITKPFSPKVLMARIKAVLRRAQNAPVAPPEPAVKADDDAPGLLTAGPLEMDVDQHEVRAAGRPVRLTLTEFKLLRALVEGRGRVLSRDRLMDKAMGTDVFVTDRAIDVHVTAIRKKLGNASWLVHTVRGVGYRLRETPPGADDES